MAVTVVAGLINGDSQSFEGEHYLRTYESLVGQGYAGKQLIHKLLTDDWAAPPRLVKIMDGEKVVATIPYR